MISLTLSDSTEGTIRNALVVAKERYAEHVKAMQQIVDAGDQPMVTAEAAKRLRDQFKSQIADVHFALAVLDDAQEED